MFRDYQPFYMRSTRKTFEGAGGRENRRIFLVHPNVQKLKLSERRSLHYLEERVQMHFVHESGFWFYYSMQSCFTHDEVKSYKYRLYVGTYCIRFYGRKMTTCTQICCKALPCRDNVMRDRYDPREVNFYNVLFK